MDSFRGIIIRYDGDDKLDELLVIYPRSVHLEYMADDHVWIGIVDASGEHHHLELTANGPIRGYVEER